MENKNETLQDKYVYEQYNVIEFKMTKSLELRKKIKKMKEDMLKKIKEK